ncbi:MAG: TetR/AcrR family transcriptional regulator, partial [Candidatus Binatia bacterium]
MRKEASLARPRIREQTHKKPVRRRRTAEDARRLILEAAEERLIDGGPEAIRLQDIAADVGISHPAVLHHFGSREGLLEALGKHATLRLQEDLLQILANRRVGDPVATRMGRAAQMLELGFEMMSKRRYARLLAGLILSGRDLHKLTEGLLSTFAQAMHEARVQRRLEDDRPAPSL